MNSTIEKAVEAGEKKKKKKGFYMYPGKAISTIYSHKVISNKKCEYDKLGRHQVHGQVDFPSKGFLNMGFFCKYEIVLT